MNILTITEAAEELRVSVKTMRRRVNTGDIGYIRHAGKICFRQEHLEEYVRRHEHKPLAPRIPESRRTA